MKEFRSVKCDEISLDDVGKTVKIAGFVETIRDFGGLVFLDIRDMYGVTQVVTSAESKDVDVISHIPVESVVSVEGKVRKRSEDTINPKLKTGLVEIYIDEIEVLGKRRKELPFEIGDTSVREDLRLKYRYLDLRSQKLKENLMLRAKIIQFLREKMIERDFLEVQTPILTSSSPEGARDYLVPSRIHKGKFYALPQAPQQFKQLLMVSGIDKYFQIAPCFRDEDARADRAPGEFYQLDMEMSYATQEDVLDTMEPVIYETFKKFGKDFDIVDGPFKRIPFKESMLKYGTDKPDLRNPLEIIDLSDFFKKCTFKPFIDTTVRAITIHSRESKGFHEKMLSYAMSIGMGGLGYLEVEKDMTFKGPIDKFIPDELKKELIKIADLKVDDTIFFIADSEKKATELAGQIRTELAKRLGLIDEKKIEFCWITDFPMYELDEHRQVQFCHNPFSMPIGGLKALEEEKPLDIKANQYDLVCNGIELASGAVRNHDPEIMIKAFEIVGYDEAYIKEKFGAMYEAFSFGAPPHAGMAPGIDRMIMILTKAESIREVIAFPLSGKAEDLMMSAPSPVTIKQLKELGLKIDVK